MLNIQWGEPRPLRQTADTMPFPLDALAACIAEYGEGYIGDNIN